MPTPDTLWQLARQLSQQGQLEAASERLREAAVAGHPIACYQCGAQAVFDATDETQRQQGLEWLLRAEHAGVPAAPYLLAQLALTGIVLPLDWAQINERLQRAAAGRHPAALRSVALSQRDSHEGQALATLCLEHAAMGGDVVSLALLIPRLQHGIGCTADADRAAAIATLLQDSGLPIAPPTRTVDTALAEPRHLADLPPLPLPNLSCFAQPVALHRLSESPAIAQADDVMSAEECQFVRLLGSEFLTPSITADPDGQLVRNPIRTSHDAAFIPERDDLWLTLIQHRMAAAAGLPLTNAEPLILLRYGPGQQYRPHRDYLPPNLIEPIAQGGSGQREATAILYLNDDVRGGATTFPLQGLSVAPRRGSLLVFRNLDANGQPDASTLHAGEPVRVGHKWICTLWIRQARFRSA